MFPRYEVVCQPDHTCAYAIEGGVCNNGTALRRSCTLLEGAVGSDCERLIERCEKRKRGLGLLLVGQGEETVCGLGKDL